MRRRGDDGAGDVELVQTKGDSEQKQRRGTLNGLPAMIKAPVVVVVISLAAVCGALLILEYVKCPRDVTVGDVARVGKDVLKDRFTGKSALVVGATRGIGRGIAMALAESGASVSIVGRSKAGGESTVQAMSAVAPLPSQQELKSYSFDLSAGGECLKLGEALTNNGARFDYVVFTVGVWPDRTNPKNREGIDKVVALDLVARFVVLRDIAPLLNKEARVMNILGSTVRAWPSIEEAKNVIMGRKPDYSLPEMLMSVGMAGDAFLQEAATKYKGVKFIGTHPGFVPTGLLFSSHTFPGWLTSLLSTALEVMTMARLPGFITVEECGAAHVQILSSPNVERRPVTYFNHQLEGRETTSQVYDTKFRKWTFAYLESLANAISKGR